MRNSVRRGVGLGLLVSLVPATACKTSRPEGRAEAAAAAAAADSPAAAPQRSPFKTPLERLHAASRNLRDSLKDEGTTRTVATETLDPIDALSAEDVAKLQAQGTFRRIVRNIAHHTAAATEEGSEQERERGGLKDRERNYAIFTVALIGLAAAVVVPAGAVVATTPWVRRAFQTVQMQTGFSHFKLGVTTGIPLGVLIASSVLLSQDEPSKAARSAFQVGALMIGGLSLYGALRILNLSRSRGALAAYNALQRSSEAAVYHVGQQSVYLKPRYSGNTLQGYTYVDPSKTLLTADMVLLDVQERPAKPGVEPERYVTAGSTEISLDKVQRGTLLPAPAAVRDALRHKTPSRYSPFELHRHPKWHAVTGLAGAALAAFGGISIWLGSELFAASLTSGTNPVAIFHREVRSVIRAWAAIEAQRSPASRESSPSKP